MRKIIIAALAASVLLSVPAAAKSGTNSPTINHTNPSQCLGAERSGRNSNGGDREQGGFGPGQSDKITGMNSDGSGYNYGDYLGDYFAYECPSQNRG